MIGQYKGFIPENIAPKGVETISIYDGNNVKKASMAVPDFMKYPSGTPLYSIGILSDLHIQEDRNGTIFAVEDFDYALSYLKSNGAVMACICGDITNAGFYIGSVNTKSEWQFAKYQEIKNKYADSSFGVYAITGNHDSYFKPITEDLALFQSYTGHGLYYSIEQGNDVYLFVGQPTSSTVLNDTEMDWLQGQLTTYAGKRCFLFIHPYIPNDSGNPFNCYSNNIFASPPEDYPLLNKELLDAIKNHGNVTVFHGHSHFKFECQNDDKNTNYTNKNGFHSVHVPSCAAPAVVTYNNENPTRTQLSSGSQFYYVEVFADCIVLNGVDIGLDNGIRTPKLIPQGIIKICT